jgi:hypothetical protein
MRWQDYLKAVLRKNRPFFFFFILIPLPLLSQSNEINFELNVITMNSNQQVLVDLVQVPDALFDGLDQAGKKLRLEWFLTLEKNQDSLFGPEIVWSTKDTLFFWTDPVVLDILLENEFGEIEDNLLLPELIELLFSPKVFELPNDLSETYDSIRVVVEFHPQVTAELFSIIDLAMGISVYSKEQLYDILSAQ